MKLKTKYYLVMGIFIFMTFCLISFIIVEFIIRKFEDFTTDEFVGFFMILFTVTWSLQYLTRIKREIREQEKRKEVVNKREAG